MHSSDISGQIAPTNDVVPSFAACRDEVLDLWRKRVAAEVPAAAKLGSPILTDTLPILYENIVEALSVSDRRHTATAGTNLGNVHGRERANMTEYGPQDLIHELQLFREVLFSVAKTKGLRLSQANADVIGHAIEHATRESISGYSAVNKEVNEAFIMSLSHDLRNPLHVANASAQLISLKTSDPGILRLAGSIVQKIRETDEMIQTLLDAAQLRGRMKLKLHLTAFDIMPLVEEVCADMPLVGQSVQVAGENLVGQWCRVSMKRVLENLASNAHKYGDPSKPITVTVSKADDRMLLSVHNEGRPIPETDISRLFNTFQRLEDVDIKGWGLGLPFVQNVIESHGGSVVVDSAEGRGTTFTVSVPIDARPYVMPQDVRSA
ncbi:HAMP domain-containing histidine kinase [Massilia sp. Dwa41.01b]|uniref:sensor histidine kinase n=1 Tax=unclassified Massilia TaxID=2609279 RepID=UPI0015FFFAB0|nr:MULTISPECIES: HAMP domain-containing sensor histidine kinase [unclassified Massilia]QNA87751.1 HAMP domain-containing histidine kinase [Massilia sp. Dwa41.01b]QNA98657.1 HAMP domain-containing histidine kinase [Massilia sp. Se16.2.3]